MEYTDGAARRRRHSVDRILALIGFLAIDFVLVTIVTTPPPNGFEISIYGAYPFPFWFCLALAVACGTLLVLRRIRETPPSRWWGIGVGMVIFANGLFLALPWFRGYYTYGRWDTLAHLGYIRDILSNGSVPGSDFYPIEHLLGVSIIRVAGFNLESVPYVFTLLFYLVYVFSIILLSRALGLSKSGSLILIALAAPLVYSFLQVSGQPSTFSLFLVPLLIYFDARREGGLGQKMKNTIPEILLGFAITLFHPVTALFIIIAFISFGVTDFIYKRILRRDLHFGTRRVPRGNFTGMTLIMIVTFFAWYLSYAAVQNSFRSVFDWLVYGSGTPLIQAIIDPLSAARLTTGEFAALLVARYGAPLLLLFAATVALLKTPKTSMESHSTPNPLGLRYGGLYLVSVAIGIVTILGFFPEYEYTPIRLFRFAILTGTILVAISLDEPAHGTRVPYNRSRWRQGGCLVPLVLIVALVALSMVSVYASPLVASPNDQVTFADVAGVRWLSTYQSQRFPLVTNIPGQVLRFRLYLLGYQEAIGSTPAPEQLPSHFGFGKNSSSSYLNWQSGAYLVVFPVDRVILMYYPESARPLVHQYTEGDFALLNSDVSVNKVYSGGQFEVWFVPGVNG